MKKLQHEALNRGIELENKLMEQLTEYDEKVIKSMTEELEQLRAEYENLKLNANVITVFNMDEYVANQKRLKELPSLIDSLHRDRLKAIDDKSEYKNSLCKGIYAELGDEFRGEFNTNMDLLQSKFDTALTDAINYFNQMKAESKSYNDALYNVISTQGIYMTLAYESYFNTVLRNHNLNQKTLNFAYAK